MTSDIFISHSIPADARIAREIRLGISIHAAQIGLRDADMIVFIAPDSIIVGSDWHAAIEESIRGCRWFLLVVTEASNESCYVQFELRFARACGKIIIPVLGEGMTPENLPTTIRHVQAVSIGDFGQMTKMTDNIVNQQAAAVWCAYDNTQPNETGGRAGNGPRYHDPHRATTRAEVSRPEKRLPRNAGALSRDATKPLAIGDNAWKARLRRMGRE